MFGFDHIDIGGQKRPIKFGTNQTAIFCQLRGITLKQFTEIINPVKIINQEIDGSEIRDLIYSGLVAGCKTTRSDVEFNEIDVGDWIDELKQDELRHIFQLYLGQLPNVERASQNNHQKEPQIAI